METPIKIPPTVKIQTFASYEALSQAVAERVAEQIKAKPDSVLGLPTGNTPLGTYKELAARSEAKHKDAPDYVDWSKARCFGLDDYIDVDERFSFHAFLVDKIYKHTNLDSSRTFYPALTDDYDGLIREIGGLDLTLLGIGNNGHIAFNEPGTCPASWTHCTWLDESTRQANKAAFEGNTPPTRAVTMGLATILSSRKILLIVSGEKKKSILEKALCQPISRDVPASLLQSHGAVEVLTDFPVSCAI